jgi:hypothetical protein
MKKKQKISATYSIDKGVEGLADKPNFGGRFNSLSVQVKLKQL